MLRITSTAILMMATAPLGATQTSIQVPWHQGQGPFSAFPLGLSMPGSAVAGEALIKKTGNQTSVPGAWSTGAYPSQPGNRTYDMASMMEGVVPASLRSLVEIDAFSTGNDVIPNQDPYELVGTPDVQAFMAYSITVSADTDGRNGSTIRQRYNRNGFASGADVFTYISSGSTGIAPMHVNRTYVNTTQSDMGFASSGGGGPEVRLDGVDWGLGVITNDPPAGTSSTVMFNRERNYLYFSLSPESATEINDAITASGFTIEFGPGLTTVDSSTVYSVKWNINDYWDAPTVYMDKGLLNLDPGQFPSHNLDALAVDAVNHTMLFSTDSDDFDQLQFFQHSPSPVYGPAPALTPGVDNRKISFQLGLDDHTAKDNDDIDGICIIDPESTELDARVGIPIKRYPSEGPPLSFSFARGFALNDAGIFEDSLVLQTTGIPRIAFASPRLDYICGDGVDRLNPGSGTQFDYAYEYQHMGPLPDPTDPSYGWKSLYSVLHGSSTHEVRFLSNDQGIDPACIYVRFSAGNLISTSAITGFLLGN